MSYELIVIGGGAAGMLAAIEAARNGAKVALLERNPKVGRKIYITGKGRCNVTNHSDVETVLSAIPQNSRFLYGAITRTPPSYVEAFFEKQGVPLKVERGNRVFPKSDKAADIIDALFFAMKRLGVSIIQDRAIEVVEEKGHVVGIIGQKRDYPCKAVILATGGASYPATGSTGDGYTMVEALGHTVVTPKPSLIPLEIEGKLCGQMQGLSLKNVTLKVKNAKKKTVYEEQGEMLFTHFGISGPLVLSASSHMRNFDQDTYTCSIDLKPALDEQTLDARLLRELGEQSNKAITNVLGTLLPRLMIPVALQVADIPEQRKCRDLTKGERRRLLEFLKGFQLEVRGPRPIAEAIITSGGVKVGEVDPKTMESKKIKGLYLVGELLDVDAYTGGFNLQIAWSTGRAAGISAAEALKEELA